MQSMQRQFNKLLSKGPGENAKVAVLLNDYEDADNVLTKVQNPDTKRDAILPGHGLLTQSLLLDHR